MGWPMQRSITFYPSPRECLVQRMLDVYYPTGNSHVHKLPREGDEWRSTVTSDGRSQSSLFPYQIVLFNDNTLDAETFVLTNDARIVRTRKYVLCRFTWPLVLFGQQCPGRYVTFLQKIKHHITGTLLSSFKV